MLIAIDGSNCSLRAIEYAGRQFSGVSDLQITLIHVLPYPPAPLWDEGLPYGERYYEDHQSRNQGGCLRCRIIQKKIIACPGSLLY